MICLFRACINEIEFEFVAGFSLSLLVAFIVVAVVAIRLAQVVVDG